MKMPKIVESCWALEITNGGKRQFVGDNPRNDLVALFNTKAESHIAAMNKGKTMVSITGTLLKCKPIRVQVISCD
jgi:hypothetical protein